MGGCRRTCAANSRRNARRRKTFRKTSAKRALIHPLRGMELAALEIPRGTPISARRLVGSELLAEGEGIMLKRSTPAAVPPSKGRWASVALSCLVLALILGDVGGCSPSQSQSAAPTAVEASTASASPVPQIAPGAASLPDFTSL